MVRNWILMLVLPLCGFTAQARSFQGEVTHVTDGDSIWVRSARGAPRQLRIRGIDAPEICQAFGREAQAALQSRVLHREVSVKPAGRDDYHRLLAQVSLRGDDVGAWMVGQGYAWAHRWHRKASGPYAALEAQARNARRGLWSSAAPVDPRDFRRLHGSCSH
jgi:endonuclease YncB( thermonuclease family)